MKNLPTGPLRGLRVFDLTRVLAGPSCVQILGDLGADVIKVEQPKKGDDTRRFGPPFIKDKEGKDTSESAYYLAANRNKRSITIDLTQSDGQHLARSLIKKSDILVENFKVGNLAKYGLSYQDLKDDFPSLVYCSITGFGQTGPMAKQPGYDFMAQGLGGLMSINGEKGGMPQRVGIPIADLTAGLWAAISINAALRHRELTGKGQQIDISLLDTQISMLSIQGLNYLTTGEVPGLIGNAHPNIVPYQVFPTADGNIIIAVGNDMQFERFCKFIGSQDLSSQERFKTNENRVINRDALTKILNNVIKNKTSEYWLKGLEKIKIASGPINQIDQTFKDPQVKYRGMEIKMRHALAASNEVKLISNPIKMSETPVNYRNAPPTLGQHTIEILEELLEMGDDEINKLRNKNVI
ncbi:MAG: CoA transferase [Rhodospirillaceae bacterium]|nr:CoA transferase [Rhodospirillaceae bacterium]OUT80074.1 MAG: CoA transferase [Rhodospirillaceae bacterium TMED23]|tara:strand:- start:923 stop:2152 length:1230 start_codon:yes stop_codon:yes gene_type:complete